ncbi:Leukocyte surface antigen CD47 [Tupaia chinensis]|uniref:Leukocyte surface antigen CD47 n=1 Tax=Tupaia chinensis TaxID=246437 RepID=L8Y0C4_TUPCH|nr:Leukocyte surface antigen CD47 [Tupaia chinensis]
MAKSDATVGNYSCEVTELSREAETTIELKYRVVKLICLLTCLLFGSQTFGLRTILIQ